MARPQASYGATRYIHYGLSNGSATPFAGLAADGTTPTAQTAAWIDYATFFQGFGALGGGNIALSAGADIVDVGASLPETRWVGGGFTAASPPQDLPPAAAISASPPAAISEQRLPGRPRRRPDPGRRRGAGRHQQSAQPGQADHRDRQGRAGASHRLLPCVAAIARAVQDGFVNLMARGSVTLGNVYDPASLPLDAAVQTPITALPGASGGSNNIWSNLFTSFGSGSGVALTSVTGDVTALTISPVSIGGLFVHDARVGANTNLASTTIGLLLPATLDLAALSGDITINKTGIGDIGNANLVPYPTQTGSDTGTINLIAAGSIDLGSGLAMPDLSTRTTQYIRAGNGTDYANYISPSGCRCPA